MLKFIKYSVESISGVGIYPTISFVIFFLFFIAMTLWVVSADKEYLKKMENLPLDDSSI